MKKKRRCGSRSLKNPRRRSKFEITELYDAVVSILDLQDYPITVRHLFYLLAVPGIIQKTEIEYRNVGRLLTRWRRAHLIDYGSFADSTRWHIRAQTFDSLDDALRLTRETYRRDLWSTQPYYCELWIEKDAIASIVSDVASDFGVPVFVCRGFASLSSLHGAAQTFNRAIRNGKQVTILHMADYDPSGHAAADAIENSLRDDFDCDIDFKRIAVTRQQIARLALPTRPTKHSTHARNWGEEESVELDAMSSSDMRRIVGDAIESLIDPYEWAKLQGIEREEKATLARTIAGFSASQNGDDDDPSPF